MPIDDALAQLGPSIITSSSGNYILLPGNPDLLISKEKKHFSKNWHEAHEELAKEDSSMLTIRQFVDFLNLLKLGNVHDENKNKISYEQCNLILDDILTQREPYRTEWLDAKFSINTNSYFSKLCINKKLERLETCLMQDKTPGIDLDYWLANANSQGLPLTNNPDGKLHYWCPKEGCVARFGADSEWVDLDCYDNPMLSDPELGVRPVKRK